MFKKIAGCLALGILLSTPLFAFAQSGPQPLPLRLVVGYGQGGAVDVLARIIAPQLEHILRRPINVENKGGAGSTIAAGYFAQMAPDGNTLFLGDSSLLAAPAMPEVYSELRYNVYDSFVPVGMIGQVDLVIAVPGASPVKTLQGFLVMAAKHPGRYTFGSVGSGSIHHLAGTLLAMKAGIKIDHVPYKGGSQASRALVANEVSMAIISLAAAKLPKTAGQIRLLAGLSNERYPTEPDLPAVSETMPGFQATPSLFLLAPKGAPAETLSPVTAALKQALADKTVQEAFLAQGAVAQFMSPDEQARWMKTEGERWADVIKQAHLTFN